MADTVIEYRCVEAESTRIINADGSCEFHLIYEPVVNWRCVFRGGGE